MARDLIFNFKVDAQMLGLLKTIARAAGENPSQFMRRLILEEAKRVRPVSVANKLIVYLDTAEIAKAEVRHA